MILDILTLTHPHQEVVAGAGDCFDQWNIAEVITVPVLRIAQKPVTMEEYQSPWNRPSVKPKLCWNDPGGRDVTWKERDAPDMWMKKLSWR